MAEEITEIDMNKYLVLKWEDIKELSEQQQFNLSKIIDLVRYNRTLKNKPDNKYLVLNMSDKIDFGVLKNGINRVIDAFILKPKVKDIAVSLVNAILKAKED